MRVLEFNVENQTIKKAPSCDFKHIISGSTGYLCAKFNFIGGWLGCAKAASFWNNGVEFAVMLDEDGMCMIPDAAVAGRSFYVSVTGRRIDRSGPSSTYRYTIKTNKLKIVQGVQ